MEITEEWVDVSEDLPQLDYRRIRKKHLACLSLIVFVLLENGDTDIAHYSYRVNKWYKTNSKREIKEKVVAWKSL